MQLQMRRNAGVNQIANYRPEKNRKHHQNYKKTVPLCGITCRKQIVQCNIQVADKILRRMI